MFKIQKTWHFPIINNFSVNFQLSADKRAARRLLSLISLYFGAETTQKLANFRNFSIFQKINFLFEEFWISLSFPDDKWFPYHFFIIITDSRSFSTADYRFFSGIYKFKLFTGSLGFHDDFVVSPSKFPNFSWIRMIISVFFIQVWVFE